MTTIKEEAPLQSTSLSTLVVVFFAFSGLFSYLLSDFSGWTRAFWAVLGTVLLNLEVAYERVKQFKAAQKQ